MVEKQLNILSAKIISKTKELKNVTSQLDNSRLKIIREKGSHRRREPYKKPYKKERALWKIVQWHVQEFVRGGGVEI